jgi:hypothetical protein
MKLYHTTPYIGDDYTPPPEYQIDDKYAEYYALEANHGILVTVEPDQKLSSNCVKVGYSRQTIIPTVEKSEQSGRKNYLYEIDLELEKSFLLDASTKLDRDKKKLLRAFLSKNDKEWLPQDVFRPLETPISLIELYKGLSERIGAHRVNRLFLDLGVDGLTIENSVIVFNNSLINRAEAIEGPDITSNPEPARHKICNSTNKKVSINPVDSEIIENLTGRSFVNIVNDERYLSTAIGKRENVHRILDNKTGEEFVLKVTSRGAAAAEEKNSQILDILGVPVIPAVSVDDECDTKLVITPFIDGPVGHEVRRQYRHDPVFLHDHRRKVGEFYGVSVVTKMGDIANRHDGNYLRDRETGRYLAFDLVEGGFYNAEGKIDRDRFRGYGIYNDLENWIDRLGSEEFCDFNRSPENYGHLSDEEILDQLENLSEKAPEIEEFLTRIEADEFFSRLTNARKLVSKRIEWWENNKDMVRESARNKLSFMESRLSSSPSDAPPSHP